MSDCEWMFGDTASGNLGFNELAHLNPLRWSGSISFERAISDLEAELSKGSRPILVKVPAGVSTTSKRFETTEEALNLLRRKSELFCRQESERVAMAAVKAATKAKDAAELASLAVREEVVLRETMLLQARAHAAAKGIAAKEATRAWEEQSDLKCEWMFGDAGIKVNGFQIAKLNPYRWSGAIPFQEGIQQLRDVQRQTEADTRKVIVRVPPPGCSKGEEHHFVSCAEAISHLEGLSLVQNKAREDWYTEDTALKAAEAKVGDAEATLAEIYKRLDAIMVTFTEAEESLESANTHAAQAKAKMEEWSKAP